MKTNRRTTTGSMRDDAVSPVIAVILMVAITVVLAATVYVWVSGFSDSGEQAPAASFQVTNCDPTAGTETVTVKLISSDTDLAEDDLSATFFYESVSGYSSGEQMGQDTDLGSDSWSVGTSKTLTPDSGGFNDGDSYSVDIVHTPSGNIISSLDVDC